ncbi:MAG TPA: hypothetical protein DEV93_19680 [Chloroflexi bacterium]|nr:hypothetical protein [Chloroflexota bacterium]
MIPAWLGLRTDWPWTSVAQLQERGILLVEDGNHGEYRPRPSEFAHDGTPFLRASDLSDGTVLFDSAGRINQDALRRIRKGIGKPGDILFSHKGTVGKLAVAPDNSPSYVCSPQTTFWRILDEAHLDRRFLYAFMRSPSFVRQWTARKGDTDMADYVSLTAQRTLLVPTPPLLSQRKIAAILSAYDDLIVNNLRRIKILVELVQRIYREWFVDFRYPGHEGPLVASELGPVPEGWRVRRLDEVADVVDCLHSKKPTVRSDGAGLLLHLANIGEAGILDLSEQFLISRADYDLWTTRIELREGDCVITNVGRVGAVGQIPPGVRAAPGRNMTGVRPRSIPRTYLLEYLLSDHMTREVQGKKDAGSIMDSLNVKGIVKLSVPVPNDSLAERFEVIARPVRRQIEVLVEVQRVLRSSRDLLLPRLISGEIDVENLDVVIPDAAA